MTPNIRPMIDQAWSQRPDLVQENTYESCFALLQLILAIAGPEWAHIGKTGGESGYAPEGFTPRNVRVRRSDGQYEDVTITHLSHDAAWHVPSKRQVKIIVNSAANSDDRESIHGPMQKGGGEIDPQYYRANNPPIAQLGNVVAPPAPVPQPPAAPPSSVLPKPQAFEALKALDAFYRAEDGLQRPEGVGGDMEAIAQWFYQLVIEGHTIDDVKAQIRASDEWKGKHR
jgi:hypothetical protein